MATPSARARRGRLPHVPNLRGGLALLVSGCLLLAGGAWPGPTFAGATTRPASRPAAFTAAASTPADGAGYRDFTYGGVPAAYTPAQDETQHKLWFNDGLWWGDLFNPGDQKFHIYKFDVQTQSWSDTGTLLDDRNSSHGDVYWDGTNLWEVSLTTSAVPKVFKYSYNSGTKSYTLLGGFPVALAQPAPVGAPSASIAKDSTGQLWVTWMQVVTCPGGTAPGVVCEKATVASSTDSTGTAWNTPFLLPGQDDTTGIGPATGIDGKDVAAIIAFGGNSVGVLWSHEPSSGAQASNNGFFFSVHADADGDGTWSATPELAWGGAYVANNHLSLATDASGQVLAAVKSNLDANPAPNGSQALIAVLRRTSGGTWQAPHTVATVSQRGPSRPILVVDSSAAEANVFFVNPATHYSPSEPRTVYRKTAPLSTLSFASGLGSVLIQSSIDYQIFSTTSTSQKVTTGTGLLVEAADTSTTEYLHGCLGAGCPVPPVADFSGTPTSTTTSIPVVFSDLSTNGPTSWDWDFGDGSAHATTQNPSHLYSAGGSYTVILTATNLGGSSTVTKAGYVTVAGPVTAPVADFTASPTAGTAPLAVQFDDTSTNAPTSWDWNFGDGTAHGTTSNPSHTYASKGKYTVTLTASNGGGSGFKSKSNYVVVSGPVVRESGPTRYETAADVAKKEFGSSAPVPVAFVAVANNWPDALAGAAAAGHKGGPVLLVNTTLPIPAATADALAVLQPARIVVLGGTGVVTDSVRVALGGYTIGAVSRESGATRYDTAADVAVKEFLPNVPVAYIATGLNFPDALTGAAAAGHQDGPVLLVNSLLSDLPAGTKSALTALKPARIVILGGTGVVPASLASKLPAYTTGSVTRDWGATRYGTAAAVSQNEFPAHVATIYIGTGLNFPDALAGAAAGGFEDGPVLLTNGTNTLPSETVAQLQAKTPDRIVILGGTGVVSASIQTQLAAYTAP